MKEYVKENVKFIVKKNERGLYDYQSQEYSEICKAWVNMSRQQDFARTALENWLDIVIDF